VKGIRVVGYFEKAGLVLLGILVTAFSELHKIRGQKILSDFF
jgi:hypothetical protein